MVPHRPSLIVICGAPASGKTTLARRLAADLRLPLLEKDVIKESLAESLGAIDLGDSRRIGTASFRLLYDLAESMLVRGADVMIEANLTRPYAGTPLARLSDHAGLLIVQCEAEATTIERRYRERAERGQRHAAHVDLDALPDLIAGLARHAYDLTGLGYPSLRVRTGDGHDPELATVLSTIRHRLDAPASAAPPDADTSPTDRTTSPEGKLP